MSKATVSQWIFRIAGIFIMASLLLGWKVHHGFFYFTAFVGFNMFQFSFTGFCPMGMILKKLGVKE